VKFLQSYWYVLQTSCPGSLIEQCGGWELNPWPVDCKCITLTTTLPCYS